MEKKSSIYNREYWPEEAAACLVLFFRFVFYKNVEIATLYPDSASYMSFEHVADGTRTPVYPSVIAAIKWAAGGRYLTGIVLFQIGLSLAAVYFLYRAVSMATGSRYIACATGVLWGCSPCVVSWDVLILSESCAISASVFFLYFAVKYLYQKSFTAGIGMVAASFVATFIRPSLVIYTAAVLELVLLQYLMKWNQKNTLRLLGLTALCIVCYAVYSYRVYLVAGVFNLSSIMPRHRLVSCLATGNYKNYPDPQLVEQITRLYAANHYSVDYLTTTPVMELFGGDWREININVNRFASYCLKTDWAAFFSYKRTQLLDSMNNIVYVDALAKPAYEHPVYRILIEAQRLLFSGIRIGHVYVMGLASAAVLIKKWITNKECPWYYLGISGMIFAIIVSVYLGTYAEFMRITVHVLPFFYFGLAVFFQEIVMAVMKKEMKEEKR